MKKEGSHLGQQRGLVGGHGLLDAADEVLLALGVLVGEPEEEERRRRR